MRVALVVSLVGYNAWLRWELYKLEKREALEPVEMPRYFTDRFVPVSSRTRSGKSTWIAADGG